MITPHASECVDLRWLNNTRTDVDPYEQLADLLPKLAVNRGWLKLIGDTLVEQKRLQRRFGASPVSEEQAAHIERKRASRARRKPKHRGIKGLALALISPRPSRRGVVVSPRGAS